MMVVLVTLLDGCLHALLDAQPNGHLHILVGLFNGLVVGHLDVLVF
jgi:hypothetical protein